MTNQNTIAMIFDCDDTLCKDSTAHLLEKLNILPSAFYGNVDRMVKKGWDPPLACMKRLLDIKVKKQLTNEKLREIGKCLEFFPGIPEMFEELREYLGEIEETKDHRMQIEYYVLTSGFEELIKGSKIGPCVNDIFGCSFDSNPEDGLISFPKSVVTFTEKTKFVFAINKGILGSTLRQSPYEVNNTLDEDERRVPFRNMIYVGDGPSDVPCFSLITKKGGVSIGVYKKKKAGKAWQLAKGRRLTVGPYDCNYLPKHQLRTWIERSIKEIALDIARRQELRNIPAPRY